MASKGKKISELQADDVITGAELIPFAEEGRNGYIPVENLTTFINSKNSTYWPDYEKIDLEKVKVGDVVRIWLEDLPIRTSPECDCAVIETSYNENYGTMIHLVHIADVIAEWGERLRGMSIYTLYRDKGGRMCYTSSSIATFPESLSFLCMRYSYVNLTSDAFDTIKPGDRLHFDLDENDEYQVVTNVGESEKYGKYFITLDLNGGDRHPTLHRIYYDTEEDIPKYEDIPFADASSKYTEVTKDNIRDIQPGDLIGGPYFAGGGNVSAPYRIVLQAGEDESGNVSVATVSSGTDMRLVKGVYRLKSDGTFESSESLAAVENQLATLKDLSDKQDKLTFGEGFSVTDNKVELTGTAQNTSPKDHYITPDKDNFNTFRVGDRLIESADGDRMLTIIRVTDTEIVAIDAYRSYDPDNPDSGNVISYHIVTWTLNDGIVDVVRQTLTTDNELSQVLSEVSVKIADLENAVDVARVQLFDKRWVNAGGSVIVSGQTYGCNGIDDLTLDEAIIIEQLNDKETLHDLYHRFANVRCRTLLPITVNVECELNATFMYAKVQAVSLRHSDGTATVFPKTLFAAFHGCDNLRNIGGVIDMSKSTTNQAAFNGCISLETVSLKAINKNIDLTSCKKLSLASLDYLVTNATNTSNIIVTVHVDVFAKLTDEANAEWYALAAKAAAKNISFAKP